MLDTLPGVLDSVAAFAGSARKTEKRSAAQSTESIRRRVLVFCIENLHSQNSRMGGGAQEKKKELKEKGEERRKKCAP